MRSSFANRTFQNARVCVIGLSVWARVKKLTEIDSQKLATYSYDDIPYPSHPFEASHPDHLYTMARLFALDALPPDTASVLELGCAGGGNIIPLAVGMPNSRIVGVDLSSKQIADGQKTVDALQLKNIQLIAKDFQSIDESFGQFDYIICPSLWKAQKVRILRMPKY
jgi:tRNA G46 methylase TrmB